MISLPLLDHWPAETFPDPTDALTDPPGLLAFGGDLSPARLRAAYAHGIFPWFSDGEPVLWWSPDPRCVLLTANLSRPNRSLRRLLTHSGWSVSFNHAFRQVMNECAAPRAGQPGTWISEHMMDAYEALHRSGHAHSVEVWDQGKLVGGIYGVMSGRLFSGESMFSRHSGGSRVALLALAKQLHRYGAPLIDAQITNPHLLGLGAIELPRAEFLRRVATFSAQTVDEAWHRKAACSAIELITA